jgi:phosphoglycolate phosphatase-like HAD superfamily hydrolase
MTNEQRQKQRRNPSHTQPRRGADLSPEENAVIAELAAGPRTIDITPESLKTTEGAAAVAKALDEWNGSAHEVANAVQFWLDEFGADVRQTLKAAGIFDALEDLHQITALVGARSRKQEAFLRALAGR